MRTGIIIGGLLVLLGGVIFLIFSEGNILESMHIQQQVPACTEEAKICPDGSYVGRSGPDCAFAECPGPYPGVIFDNQVPPKEGETVTQKLCAREGEFISDVLNDGPQRCCDGLVEFFNPDNGESAKCVKKDAEQSQSCTQEYNPVCGQPPMPVCPEGLDCIQVMPEPQTYSNECMMRIAGAEFLYRGACTNTQQTESPPNAQSCINLEYDPVCAEVDTGIRCIKAPCPSSTRKTFRNACEAKEAGAKILFDGNCDFSGTSSDKPPKNCISWFDGCNTCGAKDGEVTYCTQMACEAYQLPKCLKYK